jgi:KilA-N domain
MEEIREGSTRAGRYEGTYAHEDIVTEFCSWLSPEFKLSLIKAFQRLKKQEAALENDEWSFKRALSKWLNSMKLLFHNSKHCGQCLIIL